MQANAQAQMHDETRRRGMRPGGPNPGAFRKGDDPRRACGPKIYDGITLAQAARKLGPECLTFWHRAMRDEGLPMKDRLRASELIMERGYGKAVTTLEVRDARPIQQMSRAELMAIASGEVPQLPITIDGEAVEVPTIDASDEFATANVTVDEENTDVFS